MKKQTIPEIKLDLLPNIQIDMYSGSLSSTPASLTSRIPLPKTKDGVLSLIDIESFEAISITILDDPDPPDSEQEMPESVGETRPRKALMFSTRVSAERRKHLRTCERTSPINIGINICCSIQPRNSSRSQKRSDLACVANLRAKIDTWAFIAPPDEEALSNATTERGE